eukprot:5291006-Prymnesium_polylepis.3
MGWSGQTRRRARGSWRCTRMSPRWPARRCRGRARSPRASTRSRSAASDSARQSRRRNPTPATTRPDLDTGRRCPHRRLPPSPALTASCR